MKTEKIFIITGRSGSGKSTAVAAFEDAGFYCVDNMPVVLLPSFLELFAEHADDLAGFAFVMDLRERGFLDNYASVLAALSRQGFCFEILYLEADEETLLRRYSQTRRQHPLARGESILTGIQAEGKKLARLRREADRIIDTSTSTVHDLKTVILRIVARHIDISPIKINLMSFGFKYGIPRHIDLLVDVRFLPNPYFEPALQALDGETRAVRRFVMNQAETQTFIDKYLELLDFLIPLYEKEGKAYLTIGIGCTGGRHRSVVVARAIYQYVRKSGRDVTLSHRDIHQDETS